MRLQEIPSTVWCNVGEAEADSTQVEELRRRILHGEVTPRNLAGKGESWPRKLDAAGSSEEEPRSSEEAQRAPDEAMRAPDGREEALRPAANAGQIFKSPRPSDFPQKLSIDWGAVRAGGRGVPVAQTEDDYYSSPPATIKALQLAGRPLQVRCRDK